MNFEKLLGEKKIERVEKTEFNLELAEEFVQEIRTSVHKMGTK